MYLSVEYSWIRLKVKWFGPHIPKLIISRPHVDFILIYANNKFCLLLFTFVCFCFIFCLNGLVRNFKMHEFGLQPRALSVERKFELSHIISFTTVNSSINKELVLLIYDNSHQKISSFFQYISYLIYRSR